jgi:NADPH-dependent glutamate synthase beta subunit-like oxidoreductase/glutamate synthase domain-containing protein 3/ferredoxin
MCVRRNDANTHGRREMSVKIHAFDSNNKRISTQELLQQIYAALEDGETAFEILSSGHHDIGGPLWTADGTPLRFKVKNPGQRVGSFGLDGTEITVEGSTPADAGWLNSGAVLTIKGDSGDTTAHCAASGKIYVAGRVGTRSGSLMKHDPAYPKPELWVLKNTGSFSFEFMGGGTAVICGVDCEHARSILGDRACMGMVGGTVYVRGPVEGLSPDVWLLDLDQADMEFLHQGMPEFLTRIEREELLEQLLHMEEWKKIVAKTWEERSAHERISIHEFRMGKWVKGGIFGDIVDDNYNHVAGLVNTGEDRLKIPHWMNREFAAPCQSSCPSFIPTQQRLRLLREGKEQEAHDLVLRHSPFPASVCGMICPNLCMDSCSRRFVDSPVSMKELGRFSLNASAPPCAPDTGKSVAIIGGGPGGLSAAWQLRLKGHAVTVYEADKHLGGKLWQVIPTDRLPGEILEKELERILSTGVQTRLNTKVDAQLFQQIRSQHDAVIIATGAHNPVVIPFPGHELLIKGLDFLKKINAGEKPEIGRKVVVIGAGNAGMDVVLGAYKAGAEDVTAIDVQRPAAYQKEIDHVTALGAKIRWPVHTARISEQGLHTKEGELIPADTVIISIGERPDLSFVPSEWVSERGMIDVNDCWQVNGDESVFAIGDTTSPGLLTHAIGHGHEAADQCHDLLNGRPLIPRRKLEVIPQTRLSKELFRPRKTGQLQVIDAREESGRCISCGTCRDCYMCLDSCPEGAISRRDKDNGDYEYISDPDVCIGCGICAGICPCGIWGMELAV